VKVENLYSVTGEAISDEQCGGRVLVWMRPLAAIVTVIEVGNALKADIERPLLKCREVPIRDERHRSKNGLFDHLINYGEHVGWHRDDRSREVEVTPECRVAPALLR
jgi:hypothetical protein